MNKNNKWLISIIIGLLSCFPFACGEGKDDDSVSDDGSGGVGGGGGCEWHGNCSTRAPEGAYDCVGESIYQCTNGQWVYVVNCLNTSTSSGHYCTCKGGCGMDETYCSWGTSSGACEGHEYNTCGPYSYSVVTDKWMCVK